MKVLFRDERSHERVVIVRIADDQLLRAVDEAFDENVVDGFVDENPGSAKADFALEKGKDHFSQRTLTMGEGSLYSILTGLDWAKRENMLFLNMYLDTEAT